MRKVYYTVNKNGYSTRCNTLAAAKRLQGGDSTYEIKTCLENVEEKPSPISDKRALMLKKFGYVSKKLKNRVD